MRSVSCSIWGRITLREAICSRSSIKYALRVCHVHCKDVGPAVIQLARNGDWSFLQAVINGAFTAPGDSAVDFAAVIDKLKRIGYCG